MGIMQYWLRPPRSGAVIFYGVSNDGGKRTAQPAANQTGTTSAEAVNSNNKLAIVNTGVLLESQSVVIRSVLQYQLPCHIVLRSFDYSNAATAVALIKTTADLFQHAPYVKVVAGIVQQIIEIVKVCTLHKSRLLLVLIQGR